jgi:hypothetical protein
MVVAEICSTHVEELLGFEDRLDVGIGEKGKIVPNRMAL